METIEVRMSIYSMAVLTKDCSQMMNPRKAVRCWLFMKTISELKRWLQYITNAHLWLTAADLWHSTEWAAKVMLHSPVLQTVRQDEKKKRERQQRRGSAWVRLSPSAGVLWCNYCCTVLELGFSHVSERVLSLSDDRPVTEKSCQSASGTQWPHNLNRATQTLRLENNLSRIRREMYLEGVISRKHVNKWWSYEPNTFTRVKTTCCKGTNENSLMSLMCELSNKFKWRVMKKN